MRLFHVAYGVPDAGQPVRDECEGAHEQKEHGRPILRVSVQLPGHTYQPQQPRRLQQPNQLRGAADNQWGEVGVVMDEAWAALQPSVRRQQREDPQRLSPEPPPNISRSTSHPLCPAESHSPFVPLPGGSDSKESTCSVRVPGSIPGLGRSPGEGNDNPLQCSCLENPTDRGNLVGYSPWGHKESDTTERPTLSLHSNKWLTVPHNQDETTGAQKGAPTLRCLARAPPASRPFHMNQKAVATLDRHTGKRRGPWTFTTRKRLARKGVQAGVSWGPRASATPSPHPLLPSPLPPCLLASPPPRSQSRR